ncbi:hypothetical protein [Roseomonas elaeocarpi]|uniref:Peptidase C39-like domain-containing protein n=1 Tax=Roseomonas elaeocarpi TaxID=907779 RepID=A0ABV6JQ00_9PROT
MPTPIAEVPYFSQWESAAMTPEVLRDGKAALRRDPLWRASGAGSVEEYARWADQVCGMACLKMILAHRTSHRWPVLELARGCAEYGGYVEEADGTIRGLIYAPFTRFVRERFGIEARVVTEVTAADLPTILREADFFVASVHPAIRWPEAEPPGRGGHLVLVTEATAEGVVFHNPSGHDRAAQEAVRLPLEVFGGFFAGRGVATYFEEHPC